MKGVVILLNDVWYNVVIDFGCISSRILWIKFKFSGVKVCVVVGYSSNERDGEERDRFWNRTLDSIGNRYRLCILGHLILWIRDRTRGSITGAFGVLGENDKGRRVMKFCTENELCMGNTYFKQRSLHQYTRVARGQGVELKSIIDLVLVKRDILQYVQDVRSVRGMRGGLSDHHVVLCKVRLVGA